MCPSLFKTHQSGRRVVCNYQVILCKYFPLNGWVGNPGQCWVPGALWREAGMQCSACAEGETQLWWSLGLESVCRAVQEPDQGTSPGTRPLFLFMGPREGKDRAQTSWLQMMEKGGATGSLSCDPSSVALSLRWRGRGGSCTSPLYIPQKWSPGQPTRILGFIVKAWVLYRHFLRLNWVSFQS